MFGRDHIVLSMAALRLISGSIEMIAAILMFYFGTIQRAVVINASLALVGPCVLILVTTLGLIGLSDELHLWRIFLVVAGVALILWAVRS